MHYHTATVSSIPSSRDFIFSLNLKVLRSTVKVLSPVDTGNKVEFNTVDFVKSRQSRPCWFGPYTLATKSKKRSTFGRQSRQYRRQSRPSWRQCRPRQAVKFKLFPICCQNRQQSRSYTATVDFVADLSPVSATVDFVASVYRALADV